VPSEQKLNKISVILNVYPQLPSCFSPSAPGTGGAGGVLLDANGINGSTA
jgi:hypothetical protein